MERYHFLTSAVAPRPVAWITSGVEVVNVAPFSWFQTVCADPMLLMVSFGDRPDGSAKDTLRNLREHGECVVHMVDAAHAQTMVDTSASYPPEESEATALGLELVQSHAVTVPSLESCPVRLECRLKEEHRFGESLAVTMVLLEVVHVVAHDDALDERGNVNPDFHHVGRLGGRNYVRVDEVFEMRAKT